MGHQLVRNSEPLLARHRVGNAHLLEAALQSRHMLGKAKRLAPVNRDDLVDAVTKNESAIHDADFCVAQGRERAIEVTRGGGKLVHGPIVAAVAAWVFVPADACGAQPEMRFRLAGRVKIWSTIVRFARCAWALRDMVRDGFSL